MIVLTILGAVFVALLALASFAYLVCKEIGANYQQNVRRYADREFAKSLRK